MDRYVVYAIDDAEGVMNGFTLYGPFDDANDAAEWADMNLRNYTWWVAPVSPATEVK